MKKSLTQILSGLTHLPDRSPEMAFDTHANEAFAEVAPYRDGAVYLSYYSGSSEWERHPNGDEVVLVLAGTTTKNGVRFTYRMRRYKGGHKNGVRFTYRMRKLNLAPFGPDPIRSI